MMKKNLMILILTLILITPFVSARWTPPDYSITERTILNISDCMNLTVHVEKAMGNLTKPYSFKYCTKQNSKDWLCNCRDNAVNGTFSLKVVSSNESERMFYLTLNYTIMIILGIICLVGVLLL